VEHFSAFFYVCIMHCSIGVAVIDPILVRTENI
jgi:hypothetical protein